MKTGHIALIIAGFAVAGVATGTKKALDHTSFDNWKSVRNTGLSDSGGMGGLFRRPAGGRRMPLFLQYPHKEAR